MAVNRIKLAAFMSTAADPKYRWGDDPLSDMTAVRVADALLAGYRILPPDEQERQIAALTAENERLREALRELQSHCSREAATERSVVEDDTHGIGAEEKQIALYRARAYEDVFDRIAALGIDGTGGADG